MNYFSLTLLKLPKIHLKESSRDPLHILQHGMIPLHEEAAFGGDGRAASVLSSVAAVQEAEAQLLLHLVDHFPALGIGHIHFGRRSLNGTGLIDVLQQVVDAGTEEVFFFGNDQLGFEMEGGGIPPGLQITGDALDAALFLQGVGDTGIFRGKEPAPGLKIKINFLCRIHFRSR